MTSKERDNAFEPLVRMGLQSGPVQRGAECADAAIVAAFVERELSAAERSRWEAHFAGCAYCTAVLGAAARAGQELPQPETSRARWWAIPLTGTIAAAALAALFLHLHSLTQTTPSPAIVAESARTDELASVDKRAANLQENAPATLPSAPQMLALNEPVAREAPAAAPGNVEARDAQQKNSTSAGPRAKADQQAAAISERAIGDATSALERPVAKKELYGTAIGGAGTASENSPVNLPARSSATLDQATASVVSPIEIRSADGSGVWQIGRGGSISRRVATSWEAESSGVASDLIAGSAASSDICWVVGRGGVILRTTDGEHWEKLAPPTTSDFAGVVAQSATSAIVTASDGRRFATIDGGVSWHLQ